MGVDPITPESQIFRNEDALRDHYPDRILERDDKIEEYLDKFNEVVRNKRPRNVFVYGPTGVGKTIGTKAVLDLVHQSIENYNYSEHPEIDEPSLRTVHIECQDLNTSYQVAVRLVNELREGTPRSKISTTGYPESEVNEKLFNEIREIDETHIILALDEIDNIGEDNNLLYKLPRCNGNNAAHYVDPNNTKVGVIGITNDSTFKDDLDPRARSTLCEDEVHFPPYDANELQVILEDRAKDAFKDGTLSDDVLPLTAAFGAQRNGYARDALDLLYEAGTIARAEDNDFVTESHVREAEEQIQRGAITTEVDGLSSQAELILYSLVKLEEEGKTPVKIDELYGRYETYVNELGSDTVTSRTVHNTLNDLMMNGIVTSKEVNRGRSGGRHYEYRAGAPLDLIIVGLEGSDDLSALDDRF